MVQHISVVIPTHNRVRLLAEAIDSVLGQSHPAAEIIVVDDGSSDETEAAIRRIRGAIPVRYLRSMNLGPSAARNLGVSLAREEWIAFLDDDDVWNPDKLAAQCAHVEQHPDGVFFYSGLDHVDMKGRSVPQGWHTDELCRLVFQGNPPPYPSTVLLRRDHFSELGGFNPSMRYGEDWDLYLRCSSRWPAYYLNRRLVRHRLHTQQLHRNNLAIEVQWPQFERAILSVFPGNPAVNTALRRKTVGMYGGLATHYLIERNYEMARKYCRLAFDLQAWSWKILKRWGVSYLPVVRDCYRLRKLQQRQRIIKAEMY
jgi:glycosyltransferase involved in cell wall biosynthesis